MSSSDLKRPDLQWWMHRDLKNHTRIVYPGGTNRFNTNNEHLPIMEPFVRPGARDAALAKKCPLLMAFDVWWRNDKKDGKPNITKV